jgi:hypothetical protein
VGGGGGGTSTVYSTTSRYSLSSTANGEVYVCSSATVNTGLSWARSGTVLTVTHNAHGRSTGETVIVRNTNVDYQSGAITGTTANTYDVTVANSGGTSGSAGAYSLGAALTVGTNKYTFTMPAGGDVHILSVRFRAASSAGGVFDIEMATNSLINGVGGTTGLSDVNIPTLRVSTNADTLSAIAATIAVNNASAGYDEYRIAGLGTSLVRIFSLNF